MTYEKKMKNKNLVIIVIVAILIAAFYYVIPKQQEGFDIETVVENLDTPWAVDFLPDGKMIFTERIGNVNIYDFDEKEKTIIAEISVTELSESGLAGIAVDPEFEENNFIYLYYTYENNNEIYNRVSRFILRDNKLVNEKILLDKIPAARFHDGGRIKFGPDGKLYITTGDATNPSTAQDTNSIAGKILRINKDGSIPEDNPFGNYVYSYGHRNPQGLAWHPISKQLYASEHGPTRNDEVNIIEKGKNYGWPIVECDEILGQYSNPIRCYSEFTLAPSGIAFYKNDLYVTGLRGTQLRKIVFDKDHKTILREEELFSSLGRIRDVVEHNGYLYLTTSNRDERGIPRPNDDKIIRVRKK